MHGKMPLSKTAYGFFGSIFDKYVIYLDSLKMNLKKAGIKTPVVEYISTITLYALIGYVILIISGATIFGYVIPLISKTTSAYDMVYSFTLAIIISFAGAGGIFGIGYYYPSMRAKSRRSRIERILPFTIFHMATSASSGINPVEIFNMLSKKGGLIGEEAGRIYNDVNSLGMSLPDALQKAAARTPSPQFADILLSMATIITTGGDVQKYLSGKTKTFMSQYRRNLENYSKQISLYTEIYTTLVIVGSLFFIVMLSIMSPLVGGGGFSLFLQTFLVFFVVPAVSVGFIVLLKGIYPSE
ncbi:MAG: type II secretion system F family protein [Candidatus Aenigmatarchaeota archaeon]